MLEKACNLAFVQKMLRNESALIMQRYLHPEVKDVAQLFNERNTKNSEVNSQRGG